MAEPKIVLLDIETLPNQVLVWGLKQEKGYISHENLVAERTILCAAWKYLGEKVVYSKVAYKGNDKPVVKALHKVLSGADAVITHYGDRFDLPWIKTRALYHDLDPLPPIVQIDTWKLAKKEFLFNNNRLDYMGKFLGLGSKIGTTFGLWLDCMKGDQKAIDEMLKYNIEDVRLLERVYLKLRAYTTAKLNRQLGTGDARKCPTCGEKELIARGKGRNRATLYQRYQCKACGAWSQKPLKSNVVR